MVRQSQNFLAGFLLIILSSVISSGCGPAAKLPVKPNEHMEVGWTPRSIFQSPPYAAWYDTGYANYTPSEDKINQLAGMKDSVEYFVVYGTWCSDSKREMPRFFKIMDEIKFPADRITLVAVDRTMKIPAGIAEELGITNVPTFLVKYRGMEIGRIIESPKTSLEDDIAEYLSPAFP